MQHDIQGVQNFAQYRAGWLGGDCDLRIEAQKRVFLSHSLESCTPFDGLMLGTVGSVVWSNYTILKIFVMINTREDANS